ncbi:MAG: triphosphoribosyl-dephospho-CoA synthase [Ignisphaera sp.]
MTDNYVSRARLITYFIASAILLEVAAYPKPGNVHRARDFSDTKFEDFLITGVIGYYYISKAVARGCRIASRNDRRIRVLFGDLIEGIMRDYKYVSGGGNTCLGSSLLLLPIAVASGYILCSDGLVNIQAVCTTAVTLLQQYSTVLDSIHFYNAIRFVKPSYIRKEDSVVEPPNVWDEHYETRLKRGGYTLWHILLHSSKWDMVSHEIVNGYPRSQINMFFLRDRFNRHKDWNRAVVETYLFQLSRELDTLILRKHGADVAKMVMERAAKLLDMCQKDWGTCIKSLNDFDKELGDLDVNPGSTADIIVATIALHAIDKGFEIIR